MALTSIKRSSSRNPNSFATRAPEPQNDFLFAVRKAGENAKEVFTVSDDFLETSGLKSFEVGGDILFDDETNKVYFGIVPKDAAVVLKGRQGTTKDGKAIEKGTEFQHKDAIGYFEKIGAVSTTRGLGYGAAFSLNQVSADMLPGATALYEIVPAELVGMAKKAMNKFQGIEETPVTESTSTPAAEPAQATAEAPATASVEADEWDS